MLLPIATCGLLVAGVAILTLDVSPGLGWSLVLFGLGVLGVKPGHSSRHRRQASVNRRQG
jgi:hypothetical protein